MFKTWTRETPELKPSSRLALLPSAVALAPLLRKEGASVLGLTHHADGKKAKIGVIFSGGNVELK